MKINEVRVLTNVRLSETQKIVMTRIVAADNPHVAYEGVNEGRNLVSSAKELVQIGLIELFQGQANITDKGNQVLQNEGLTDESGELTEQGDQYASQKGPSEKGKDAEPPEPTETGAPQEPAAGQEDMGMEDGEDEMQMNSFSLISDMEDKLLLKEQLDSLK
jgi:hypothetical protein